MKRKQMIRFYGFFLLLLCNTPIQGVSQNRSLISIDTVVSDSFITVSTCFLDYDKKFTNYCQVQKFYNSGELKTSYNTLGYDKIYGIVYEYYRAGQLKTIVNYYESKRFGNYLEFHQNGRLSIRGSYASLYSDTVMRNYELILYGVDEYGDKVETKSISRISLKDGVWSYWSFEGELFKEEVYENGVLVLSKRTSTLPPPACSQMRNKE